MMRNWCHPTVQRPSSDVRFRQCIAVEDDDAELCMQLLSQEEGI